MNSALLTFKQFEIDSNLPIVTQAQYEGEEIATVTFSWNEDGSTTITSKGATDLPTHTLVQIICASHAMIDSHYDNGEKPMTRVVVYL